VLPFFDMMTVLNLPSTRKAGPKLDDATGSGNVDNEDGRNKLESVRHS
jgi:hypothetical protein